MSNFVSILGMTVILGIAFVLDSWTALLQGNARSTLNPYPLIWAETVANLVFVILMIFFAGLVLIKQERRVLRAVIFIIVGVAITFYLPFLTLRPEAALSLIQSSALHPLHTTLMDLGQRSYLVLAAVYTLIVGLVDVFGWQNLVLRSVANSLQHDK
jgi:hypothetical protein